MLINDNTPCNCRWPTWGFRNVAFTDATLHLWCLDCGRWASPELLATLDDGEQTSIDTALETIRSVARAIGRKAVAPRDSQDLMTAVRLIEEHLRISA